MHTMNITLVSLATTDEAGHLVARARAIAPGAHARLWIALRFEPEQPNPWDEAYDRVLQLLDVA